MDEIELKMRIEEEADESALWLELIMEGGLMSSTKVTPLHDEATELAKIMMSSRITASRRQNAIKNQKSKIKNL